MPGERAAHFLPERDGRLFAQQFQEQGRRVCKAFDVLMQARGGALNRNAVVKRNGGNSWRHVRRHKEGKWIIQNISGCTCANCAACHDLHFAIFTQIRVRPCLSIGLHLIPKRTQISDGWRNTSSRLNLFP